MLNKKFLNFYFVELLLYIFWAILLVIVFIFKDNFFSGITFTEFHILSSDSHRYLYGANEILNLNFPEGSAKKYMGYNFFLSLFFFLGLDLNHVVIFQSILTLIAAKCLFEISLKYGNNLSSFIVIILFLFYLPLQVMNFYILTDIFYLDLFIVGTYFLLKDKSLINSFFSIFILLFCSTIRPHGLIIYPIILIYIYINFFIHKSKEIKITYSTSCSILFLFSLIVVNNYLPNNLIINSFINGDIIWGYKFDDNYIFNVNYENSKYELLNIFNFISNNFVDVLIITIKKLFYFFFRIRPYYSDSHNFYIIFYNVFIYTTSLYCILINTDKKLKFYCLLIIFLNSLIVMLTFADWSGRFSLYIMPIIFILSSIGASKILLNLNYKKYFS